MRRQDGFTLLEMLIALMIVSIIGVVLFRLFTAQAELTYRFQRIAADVQTDARLREAAQSLLRSAIPGWEERPEEAFTGSDAELSFLSEAPLHRDQGGLAIVKLTILSNELVYESEDQRWILFRFGERASFEYLGYDNRWYDSWPQLGADFGSINDSAQAQLLPLPRAVRIIGAGDGFPHWFALMDWRSDRLFRQQGAIEDE